MQEVEQFSQDTLESSQALDKLSQVDDENIQWMDMETFANAAGKTQQGVSYLINKGSLKQYKEEGVRIKKSDKWYLDAALVELVKAKSPLKTVGEKEALTNQLRNTSTALVKYKEFEKRIQALEDEKTQLSQQVQELVADTENKLQNLQSDKDDLQAKVEQLVQEIELLKTKPWWMFW